MPWCVCPYIDTYLFDIYCLIPAITHNCFLKVFFTTELQCAWLIRKLCSVYKLESVQITVLGTENSSVLCKTCSVKCQGTLILIWLSIPWSKDRILSPGLLTLSLFQLTSLPMIYKAMIYSFEASFAFSMGQISNTWLMLFKRAFMYDIYSWKTQKKPSKLSFPMYRAIQRVSTFL